MRIYKGGTAAEVLMMLFSAGHPPEALVVPPPRRRRHFIRSVLLLGERCGIPVWVGPPRAFDGGGGQRAVLVSVEGRPQ